MNVTHAQSRVSEIFYWTTIVVSNTLGTALGDFTAYDLDFGFSGGAGMYGGLMVLTAFLAFFCPRINRVALFWFWFIMSRPFGVTFGDLLTKSKQKHGLAVGTKISSVIFGVPTIVLILMETAWIWYQRSLPPGEAKAEAEPDAAAHAPPPQMVPAGID